MKSLEEYVALARKVKQEAIEGKSQRQTESIKSASPLDGLTEGCLIEWKSPILGLLSGRVQMIPGDGTILVDHPLNDGMFGPAFIQIDWVTRVLRGDAENATKTGAVSSKTEKAPQKPEQKNER